MRAQEAEKDKRRVRTSNTVISQKQATVCSNTECGRTFSEPIELSVTQPDGSLETYHACPHCFSRVSLESSKVEERETPSDKLKKRPSEEAPPGASKKDLEESAKGVEKIKPAGCPHFLGYLKTRPRGSPIPDECLTCVAIIECM